MPFAPVHPGSTVGPGVYGPTPEPAQGPRWIQCGLDEARTESSGGLAPVLEWAHKHLDQPLTLDALAQKALMSTRTFARRFREETGTTPHQWLTPSAPVECPTAARNDKRFHR